MFHFPKKFVIFPTKKPQKILKKCGNSSINLTNFSNFRMHLVLNLHNMATCNVNMIISAATKYPLSHPHAQGAILVHSNIHFKLSIHDPSTTTNIPITP
jgi:hypothetical protein